MIEEILDKKELQLNQAFKYWKIVLMASSSLGLESLDEPTITLDILYDGHWVLHNNDEDPYIENDYIPSLFDVQDHWEEYDLSYFIKQLEEAKTLALLYFGASLDWSE